MYKAFERLKRPRKFQELFLAYFKWHKNAMSSNNSRSSLASEVSSTRNDSNRDFFDTKKIRVMACTWNMAGKMPSKQEVSLLLRV